MRATRGPLPGDSLLFAAGSLVAEGLLAPLWVLLLLLPLAPIAGDLCGCWIGRTAGPAVFDRPDPRLFTAQHIECARLGSVALSLIPVALEVRRSRRAVWIAPGCSSRFSATAGQPAPMTHTRTRIAVPVTVAALVAGDCGPGAAGGRASAGESNPLGDIPDDQVAHSALPSASAPRDVHTGAAVAVDRAATDGGPAPREQPDDPPWGPDVVGRTRTGSGGTPRVGRSPTARRR